MTASPIHFLHIRKTGGMAMKAALEPVAAEFGIVLHNHNTTLADVPNGERVFFIVREPAARFVSGFNSRLRKGQPLLYNEWTKGEEAAFARFRTPSELAEALSSPDEGLRRDAALAMREIRHVNSPLNVPLGSPEAVAQRLPNIVWVAFTETLAADLEEIKRRLALPASVALPDDAVRAHRTPEAFSTALSPLGRQNIEEWYAADRAFLAWLREARGKAGKPADAQ